jgi:hypothetical protein
MNPDSPPATLPAAQRQRRFLILRLSVAAICVFVASILLVVPLARPPVGTAAHLTPAGRDRLTRPGALTKFKWKLKRLTAPILHHIWKGQPIVGIESQLFAVPPAQAGSIELPRPATTTADGERAWVLSPSDLKALRQRLQALPGATLLGSPSIHTIGGGSAQLSSVKSVYVPWKSASVGLTIDVAPNVTGNSVRLIVSAVSTEVLPPTNPASTTTRTNFAINYQAWMHSQSGLVVDTGKARDSQGNGYWFIVLPTVIDEFGRPRP